jgi:hypothetical protein
VHEGVPRGARIATACSIDHPGPNSAPLDRESPPAWRECGSPLRRRSASRAMSEAPLPRPQAGRSRRTVEIIPRVGSHGSHVGDRGHVHIKCVGASTSLGEGTVCICSSALIAQRLALVPTDPCYPAITTPVA